MTNRSTDTAAYAALIKELPNEPQAPAVPGAAPALPGVFLWRTVARWLLIGLALTLVGWLLWQARSALFPFIIGLILAYLLLPFVNALARRMARTLAILIVYASGIAVLVGAIAYVVPPVIIQIQQLITSIPSFERLQAVGTGLLLQYQRIVPEVIKAPVSAGINTMVTSLQANIAGAAQGLGAFLVGQVLQIFNTVTFLIGFVIIPFWLFYVLSDEVKGRNTINRWLHPRVRDDFWNSMSMINTVLRAYIRGQLLLALSVGVMVWVSMTILGLFMPPIGDYALLLGIISGATELVPVLGPTLGAIPALLFGLIVDGGTGLVMLAIYVGVQQIENMVLVPRILGGSVDIHPAILIVLLIVMGHIFGLLGVLLAAPLAAIARDVFVYIYRRLEACSPAVARAMVREHGAPSAASPDASTHRTSTSASQIVRVAHHPPGEESGYH
jgi:predicted PurR-regulated permease PerM